MAAVVVPYVPGMLHERTAAWAAAAGATCWELARDDEAYWRALNSLWAGTGTDLAIVEQDVVPAPGVVDRMLACRRPWCASPYVIGAGTVLADGLGCTVFSARLKDRHAELMQHVGEIDNDGLPAKNWRRLDTRISSTLRGLGYRPHVHARSEHLHDYARRP